MTLQASAWPPQTRVKRKGLRTPLSETTPFHKSLQPGRRGRGSRGPLHYGASPHTVCHGRSCSGPKGARCRSAPTASVRWTGSSHWLAGTRKGSDRERAADFVAGSRQRPAPFTVLICPAFRKEKNQYHIGRKEKKQWYNRTKYLSRRNYWSRKSNNRTKYLSRRNYWSRWWVYRWTYYKRIWWRFWLNNYNYLMIKQILKRN